MRGSTIMRTAAVGATCALVGAGAGIAGSSASTPRKTNGPARFGAGKIKPGIGATIGAPGFTMTMAAPGRAGPPVHSESVVPNERGSFETVTMDRGMFSSLSGEQLTIAEGTKTATYKTVTLTIPSDAKVYVNGETAQLSDIKSGDTVTVVRSPAGTVVSAYDAEHEPKQLHKIAPGEGPPLPRLRGFGPLGKSKLTPPEKAAAEESLRKFAKCMREHGIKVETSTAGGGFSVKIGGPGTSLNPESPSFQTAQKVCQGLMPRPPGAPQGAPFPPKHPPADEKAPYGSESGAEGSSASSESTSSGGD